MNRWVAIGLGLWLGVIALRASAEDCQVFGGLVSTAATSDPFEFSGLQEKQIAMEESVARLAAGEFLTGQVPMGHIVNCVAQYQERNRFLLTFQYELIQSSLARLRHARSPRIREFVRRVDARSDGGTSLTIRLTGHGVDVKPVDKKAGYHRTNQSIFMDMDSIDSKEWLIILIHELTHYLDDRVYQSVKAFLNKDTVAQILAVSGRTGDLNDLSVSERAQLDGWLQNGMDAGLLAEYRAWAVTVLLYNDGLDENLWSQVKWMEDFKSEIGSPMNPWAKLMTYLNRRGLEPSHPLCGWPLVKAALAEKRKVFLNHPPPMYEFDSLF